MAKSHPGLLWAAICCLLLAVGAYFVAREQDRIRSLYGDAPQRISGAQLAEQGYGNNIWVELADVELLPEHVVQTRKGAISAVWFAAVPKGQAEAAREIKLVLRSTRCKSDAEIAEKFRPRDSYRGAVINPTLLQPYEPYRPLLKEAFSKLQLAPTIWEVDIDYLEKPSDKWASGFYAAAGTLAIIGAICGIAWCLVPRRTVDRVDHYALAEPTYAVRG
ncbi:MAG TPA: hypothetical protein VG826_09965 [Pirellulales bacterium]|nr:hypothetical protein [Pirellulales bacterium]